jgi:hypothetical protein
VKGEGSVTQPVHRSPDVSVQGLFVLFKMITPIGSALSKVKLTLVPRNAQCIINFQAKVIEAYDYFNNPQGFKLPIIEAIVCFDSFG